MKTVLFDEKGIAQDATSPSFRRRMDALPGFDLVRFMVVNAGWVAIRADRTRLVLTVRPSKVLGAALAGALYFIGDADDGPCCLVLLEAGDLVTYEFRSRSELITALCDAVGMAQPNNSHRFKRKSVPYELLSRDCKPALDLLEVWAELDGKFDMERLWRCINISWRGRFAVVRADRDAMRVTALGLGFKELARFWGAGAVSERLHDQPDAAYGLWLANAYRQAIHSQSPLIEQVDCNVEWAELGMRRHRYWRVIIPMTTAEGSNVALGVTLPDRSIALLPDTEVGIES